MGATLWSGTDLYFSLAAGHQRIHHRSTDLEIEHHEVCLFTAQPFTILVAPTCCTYLWRDDQAELIWVAGYTLRWFICPQMVTHPNTKQAKVRATVLIETNTLLLSPTATTQTLHNNICSKFLVFRWYCENMLLKRWLFVLLDSLILHAFVSFFTWYCTLMYLKSCLLVWCGPWSNCYN